MEIVGMLGTVAYFIANIFLWRSQMKINKHAETLFKVLGRKTGLSE